MTSAARGGHCFVMRPIALVVVLASSGCYLAHEREAPPPPEWHPACHPPRRTLLAPASPPEIRAQAVAMSISDDGRWLTYSPWVFDDTPGDDALPESHSFVLDRATDVADEVGVSVDDIHHAGAYVSGDGSTLLIPDAWDPAEAAPIPESVTLIDRATRARTLVPIAPWPFREILLSDDGSRLAFRQCEPAPGETICGRPYRATVLDVPTGVTTPLGDRVDTYAMAFAGSGDRVALVSVPPDGYAADPIPDWETSMASLSTPTPRGIGAVGWAREHIAISDDGRVIVSTRAGQDVPSDDTAEPGIDLVVWREDDAADAETLCAGRAATWPVYDVVLSGDGSAAIVSTASGFATDDPFSFEHQELVRIGLDDGSVQLLARCNTIGIFTSADGRTVAANVYDWSCPDLEFPEDGPSYDEEGNFIGYEGTSIAVFEL